MRELAQSRGRVTKKPWAGGAWVAQMVGHLTLDFSSGHDLMVLGSSPMWGSVLTVWSLLGILSPFLSLFAPHPLPMHTQVPSLSLSLKINDH